MAYRVEVQKGDTVLHTIRNKEFSNQSAAWRYIEKLSHKYDTPGTRFLVKDKRGEVWLMAGLTNLQNKPEPRDETKRSGW